MKKQIVYLVSRSSEYKTFCLCNQHLDCRRVSDPIDFEGVCTKTHVVLFGATAHQLNRYCEIYNLFSEKCQ